MCKGPSERQAPRAERRKRERLESKAGSLPAGAAVFAVSPSVCCDRHPALRSTGQTCTRGTSANGLSRLRHDHHAEADTPHWDAFQQTADSHFNGSSTEAPRAILAD